MLQDTKVWMQKPCPYSFLHTSIYSTDLPVTHEWSQAKYLSHLIAQSYIPSFETPKEVKFLGTKYITS